MTDAKAAALRLLATLPVRTHRVADDIAKPEAAWQPRTPKRRTGSGPGGTNARPVTYAGRQYRSINAAAAATGLHHSTIRRELKLRGKP